MTVANSSQTLAAHGSPTHVHVQMITVDGPRAGACTERPVSLGWLQQAVEQRQMPRDAKVWAVEGGKAWVRLGKELDRYVTA